MQFKVEGNISKIYNVELLAKEVKRSLKSIMFWYSKQLSCRTQYITPYVKLYGAFRLKKLKFLESQYLKNVICCPLCTSLETQEKSDGSKYCYGCNASSSLETLQ